MKVKGLDGRNYTLKASGWSVENNSDLHFAALEILTDMFGTDTILQEVPIPSTNLRFDFVLPLRRLAIEVQGRQHYEQNSHFHSDVTDFWKSKTRDNKKKQFCELNDITLLELRYDEQKFWRDRIRESFGND